MILTITTYLTYKANVQFGMLTLFVCSINFLIETLKMDHSKILNDENTFIFKYSDFSTIIKGNLVLVFFKLTYWMETYIFNINEIINYFIIMIIIVIIQILYVVIFKLLSLYNKTFNIYILHKNYKSKDTLIMFLKVFLMSKNQINIFRALRQYLCLNFNIKKNFNAFNALKYSCFYKEFPIDINKNNIQRQNTICYQEFQKLNNIIGCEVNE